MLVKPRPARRSFQSAPPLPQPVRQIEVERQMLRVKHDLSEVLRSVMQGKGISQHALARRMETSRSVVYRLLSAKRDSINLRSIARIAKILEIDLTLALDP